MFRQFLFPGSLRIIKEKWNDLLLMTSRPEATLTLCIFPHFLSMNPLFDDCGLPISNIMFLILPLFLPIIFYIY